MLRESRVATVSIAVDPVVVQVGVEGDYVMDELGNRRAIVPENVDWFEEGTLGGSRVADNMHEGIDFYDNQLRDATVSITNNFPVEITGYWCPTFITYAGGWSIEDYGSRVRAYRNVDSQWEEIFTYERFMVTLEPSETLVLPLILEGISSTGFDDLTFRVDFHVVNIDDEYLQGGLRSVPDTCDHIALSIAAVDLAVGPTNASMPELFEDDLPYVVPMNRDYDLGYVDGQGQPVPDGAGGTDMLPENWASDDELVQAAIHFPFPFDGTWTLTIPPDLRVWNSATRERVVSGVHYEFNSTLWCMSVGLRIEGVAPSETTDNFLIVSAQFTDAEGAPLGTPITDRTKYEVVAIDIEIAKVSELDEETHPAFVPINDDYDEGNEHGISGDPVTDNGRLHEQLVSDAPGIISDDDDLVHATLTIDGPRGQVGLYWIEVLNEPSWLSYPDWPGNAQFIRVWLPDGTEVPRDEYSALPIVLDDELDLLIEGLALSQCELALKAHFIPAGDYAAAGVFPVVTDEAEAIPVKIDLDIDSDNNNGYDPPDHSPYEDQIEAVEGDPTKPGKIIIANDNDDDADGIPDYADGFNKFGGTSNQTAGEQFTPLVLEILDPIDLALATVQIETFQYGDSDPNGVDRTGSGTEADPYVYTKPVGHIRIWTKNGNAARNPASVMAGGDWVQSDTYDASDLGFGPARTVTLYIEGIDATIARSIYVFIDPDGTGPAGPIIDCVRYTVVQAGLDIYNGGADLDNGEAAGSAGTQVAASRELTEGAYLLVNWDDDADCQMNADGSFSHLPVPDLTETFVANEDNLARLNMTAPDSIVNNICKVELEVTGGGDKIKLWTQSTKGTELALNGGKKTWDLSDQQQLAEFTSLCQNGVWIEGIAASAAERDVSFALHYKLNDDLLITHAVKATVVMIKIGNAVYRENSIPAHSARGHAALVYAFYGPCTRSNLMDDSRFGIIEMPGVGHGVEAKTLSSITAAPGLVAWGCYTNTADINYVARLRILKWVRKMWDDGSIGYPLLGRSALEPADWNDHLDSIDNLRCDGLVEVCYEANGIDVWGKSPDHYDIRDNAYQVEHDNYDEAGSWYDTLQPATQCGHVTLVDAVTTFLKDDLCTPIGSSGGN